MTTAIMREQELLDAVIELAKFLGWRVMHQRPGRTMDGYRTAIQGHTGFPDLVLLRPPRLVFAELKGPHGRVHHDQAIWLNGLNVVPNVEQYLWRPADWTHGDIEQVLR